MSAIHIIITIGNPVLYIYLFLLNCLLSIIQRPTLITANFKIWGPEGTCFIYQPKIEVERERESRREI